MSEYIIELPDSGAADEFVAKMGVEDCRIYGYRLTGEIVRCRDCEMFDEHYLKCFRPVLYFDHDYMPHWTDETTFTAVTDATPDGFCAWGDRRDA